MSIGEKTEHIVCSILHYEAKMTPLTSNLKSITRESRKDIKYIKKKDRTAICDIINGKGFSSFNVTSPSDGSSCGKRSTADILLYNRDSDRSVGLSIKHNNMSIKHHRPHMLHKQMRLSSDLSFEFQNEYKRIEDKWLKFTSSFSKYNEIDAFDRRKMLNDFNVLTTKWLNNNIAHISTYVNFIMDKQTPYILKVNSNGTVEVYKKKRYIINNPFIYVNHEKGCINIVLDRDNNMNPAIISMRLHTCSKYIKSSLDIKFDVTAYGIFNKIA